MESNVFLLLMKLLVLFIAIFIVYLMQRWAVSQPDARLGLPLPNVFIPTDLTLKQLEEKVMKIYLHDKFKIYSVSLCSGRAHDGSL